MKQIHKVAVIGGTGKSGQYVVQQLLKEGYALQALHRHPESRSLQPTSLTWIKGNARDYSAVFNTINGCDAVVSTLGQPKGERSIFSDACTNVIRAMQEANIKRYIVTTGLNVDTPFDKKSAKTQMATDWMKANYTETTLDKQKEYQLLSDSNLDWTMVRLPLIDLTDELMPIVISTEDCKGEKISATSLAHFLVKQLTEPTYVKQAPFIANK